MDESTGESRKKTIIGTLAGGFAAFTICYAVFNFACGGLGIEFDKSSVTYKTLFIAAYLLVNAISWPIIRGYNK